MTATQRKFTVGVLVVFSIASAICFAMLLGTFLHMGQGAAHAFSVGSPDPVPAPSWSGYVVLILTGLGTLLGGSWAKWLAMAANAAPSVETLIRQIPSIQGVAIRSEPLKPVGALGSLISLIQTLDFSSGTDVTSKGEHAVPGGQVTWTITFTPTVKQPGQGSVISI